MFRMTTKEMREKRYIYKKIQSPVGPLTLVACNDGLCGLLFQNTTIRSEAAFKLLEHDDDHVILRLAEEQLSEYFNGLRRRFDIPMIPDGTSFQRRVWNLLLDIPYGETVSYGDIAARMGDPRKARPVGGAVGANPIGIIIPCHRVIGRDGSLTGFGGGLEVKTFLLNLEKGQKEA